MTLIIYAHVGFGFTSNANFKILLISHMSVFENMRQILDHMSIRAHEGVGFAQVSPEIFLTYGLRTFKQAYDWAYDFK